MKYFLIVLFLFGCNCPKSVDRKLDDGIYPIFDSKFIPIYRDTSFGIYYHGGGLWDLDSFGHWDTTNMVGREWIQGHYYVKYKWKRVAEDSASIILHVSMTQKGILSIDSTYFDLNKTISFFQHRKPQP